MQAVFCQSQHSSKVVEGRTAWRGNTLRRDRFISEGIALRDSEQETHKGSRVFRRHKRKERMGGV